MKLRFAMIGTNFISANFLQAAALIEDFELVAIYSRQKKTAKDFIVANQIPLDTVIYTDMAELQKDPSIDAVYIASPNSFHASQAIALLNAGKHVLGEKPSASNKAELLDIIASAKANNRCYMEALLTTHMPNYAQLKKHLPRIGTPRKYIGQYCQYSSRYEMFKQGERPNAFLPKFSNGALVDIGIYPLYPIVDLWGEPNIVRAQSIMLETGVDGATDLLLDWEDKQASISCSKISDGHNYTEIQGELGRIEIYFISTVSKIHIYLNTGETEELSIPQKDEVMFYELTHFMSIIREGRIESDINTWTLSNQVMTIIDEARKQAGIIYPSDSRQ